MASSVKLSDLVPSRFAHLTPPDESNIERIKDDLLNGSKVLLNVPHVFKNEAGKYELLAGHDRTEAVRRTGKLEIQVRDFSGTCNSDDAILAHFCRENLLRKEVSKAAIAGEWLRKHPDWTDSRVAGESGCTHPYVGEVRAQLVAAGDLKTVTSREGRDGRTYKAPAEVRQPKRGPLASKSSSKPKETPAEKMAREITQSAAAKAAQQSPQVAERKAPEPRSSTGRVEGAEPDTLTDPEVGAPTGARSAEPEIESAGAVPDRLTNAQPSDAREPEETPAVAGSEVSPALTAAVDGEGRPLSREEQIAALRELQARTSNPNARLPRRPPIPRLMEFVRTAIDLEEPSADEVDAIPTNDLMLEHLERAHRIIGLILTRNGRSAAA